MVLLTAAHWTTMLLNGHKAQADENFDPEPVVKLFTPDGAATWLLCWLEPEDTDIAFGLCDLGLGFPELGSVRISEIESVRGHLRLPVERDLGFKAKGPISLYARLSTDHIVYP